MTPEERAARLTSRWFDYRAPPSAIADVIREAEADARRAALEEAARAVCIQCAAGRKPKRNTPRKLHPDYHHLGGLSCPATSIWLLLEEPSDE